MQLNGIVSHRYISDAAIVQKIQEGNEYTAGAETCFTYAENVLPWFPGRKDFHEAAALKKDVPGFFNGIDHIEIAVVIMFVHKIGRNLHGQTKSVTDPVFRKVFSPASLRGTSLSAEESGADLSIVMNHCNMGREKKLQGNASCPYDIVTT
jgi:hypothetical protein